MVVVKVVGIVILASFGDEAQDDLMCWFRDALVIISFILRRFSRRDLVVIDLSVRFKDEFNDPS